MRSLKALEALKSKWLSDPCWDIECSVDDGFGIFFDELVEWRYQQQAAWREERRQELETRSIELGIPGNHRMVKLIEHLECRIEKLEDRTRKLEGY
jgi:hypothetical protein